MHYIDQNCFETLTNLCTSRAASSQLKSDALMHREWNFALQCQRQSVHLTQPKRNSSLCFSFDVLIVNLTFTNILYLQMKRLIGQFRDNSPGKVMMGQLRPGPRSLHPAREMKH